MELPCCGVTCTWYVEPGAKLTLPPTSSVVFAAPGAAVPPVFTIRPPTLPVPPSVPPLFTVTVELPMEPFTANVPAFTRVGPEYVLVPLRLSCPDPSLTTPPVPLITPP